MIDTLPTDILAAILDHPGEAPCPGVEIEFPRSLGAAPVRPGESPHELSALLVRPSKPTATPGPALIAWHGGGFQFGSPEGCGVLAKTLALTLGITTIAPTYRLATAQKPTFPGVLDDGLHSWRWVQSHAAELNIDPARVAVVGESAGNLLAMHLAVASPFISYAPGELRPAAFICQWGPLDFVARWFDLNESAGPESVLLGADYTANPSLYHLASPLTHACGELPPALLVYGRQDTLVHPRQGRLALAAWQAAGRHAELKIIPNIGHGTAGDTRESVLALHRAAIAFLSYRLRAEPLPQP
jgi:acetyl esterase/lipase